MREQRNEGWWETVSRALVAMGMLSLTTVGPAVAGGPSVKPSRAGQEIEAAPGEILVRFKPGMGKAQRGAAHAAARAHSVRHYEMVDGLELATVDEGGTVESALAEYVTRSDVLYAEPNFRVEAQDVPNDPSCPLLWGMHLIDAPEAWDMSTGSRDVVVMILDTGIDYDHPDLRANVWSNPLDCDFDGVDDDGNGYVDDCHGIDVVNHDSDPFDDRYHGTHVAGTIGAVGNNGLGVVGVNHAISMMACKFLNSQGTGNISDALTCLEYAATMKDRGIDIVATNNSWGGGGYSQAFADALEAQRQRGILFVAAAGNNGSDNDTTPFYPASYPLPNVIAVAATDISYQLASFSNYGRSTVHVGAPGVDILSTLPGGGYGYLSGTSMAAPHVTGLVALLKADNPDDDWASLRDLVLTTGDPEPGTIDGTSTGLRINANQALLASRPGIPTGLTTDGTGSGELAVVMSSPATLRWNASAAADRYEVTAIHWDSSTSSWVHDGSHQTPTNVFALPLPAADTYYAWEVRAGNARGWSDFSPYAIFYHRSCTFSISPASASFRRRGGSGFVNVSATSGCRWTARSNDRWIAIISGSSGSGSGVVTYSVGRNRTRRKRSGTLTIAGKTFTVTQAR